MVAKAVPKAAGILASTRSVFASAPPASRPSPQSRGTAGGRRRGRRSPCHGETGRRRDASGDATHTASMTTRLAPPSRGMPAILPKPSVLPVAVKSLPPGRMFRVFLATSMPAPGRVVVSRSHPRDGSVLQPGHPSGPRETIGMTGRPRFFTDPIARSRVISVRPAMRNLRCRRPRTAAGPDRRRRSRIGNEPGRESERKRRSCPRETRAIPSTATLSPVSDSSVIRGEKLRRAVPLDRPPDDLPRGDVEGRQKAGGAVPPVVSCVLVSACPDVMGRDLRVRPKACICGFSSTESTTAWSGGLT